MAGSATRKLEVIIVGDAKGLGKALQESGDGTASLGSKLASLGPIVATAGAAVATGIVAVGVGLFKLGESFDDAYDNIRVKTGATGDELDGLKQVFKDVVQDVPTDFGKASDAIALLAQKFGAGEPAVTGMAEQFLELSRITKTDLTENLKSGSNAIANWGIAAGEAPAKLDLLFRASQVSGVSFNELAAQMSDSGVQLRALGFDFEQGTTVIAGLGKAGMSVADVLPALSKTMAAGAKEGKSAQDVYQGLVRSIKEAPTDIAAASVALDVLGAKAGPKFAAMIREGKLSLDELGNTIVDGTDTILGAGKETQDFGEKWTLIKNRVLVALEPLAMKVFDAVGKAMDRLGPIIADLSVRFRLMAAWVEEHWPQIQATITGAITRVHDIVAPIVEILQALWANFGDNVLAYVIAVWPYVQQTIEGVMTTIEGVINTVLAVIHGDWGAAWEGIQQIFSGVWNVIVGSVGSAIEQLKFIIGVGLEIAGSMVSGAWDGIVDFIVGLPSRIGSAAVGMWDGIVEAFKSAINAVIAAWNSFGIPSFHVHITMPSVIPNIDFDTPSIDFPNIPFLAKGGIVTGPTLAMLGDNASGKEAIIPLEKAGQMGFGTGPLVAIEHYHAASDANEVAADLAWRVKTGRFG